jgi:uncharacterized protein YigE (DUF2233 family)
MNKKDKILVAIIFLLAAACILVVVNKQKAGEDRFITHIVDCKTQDLRMYYKDDKQENFKSIQNLKTWLERNHKELLFAMNAGMYKQDGSPQGLYIENQLTVTSLDTSSANGNFYLKPNGVFYITSDNIPLICNTPDFLNNGNIKYATQSGPMLVIDGQIHSAFTRGSNNVNIRNGVGILPNDNVAFAMSKDEINFYDFAEYFKNMGCKNALYLDGLVSRTYLPEKDWIQVDGDFGVIIGVAKSSK